MSEFRQALAARTPAAAQRDGRDALTPVPRFTCCHRRPSLPTPTALPGTLSQPPGAPGAGLPGACSQHHARPLGADSRASGEPPTSWWMLSMARLYLSHSLCMLSKLREKGGCVSGLQCTQLSQMQRAGPSLQGGLGFQNHLHSRPPEAAPCDSVWPSLARSASTACSMSRARHHEEELGNKLRQRLG